MRRKNKILFIILIFGLIGMISLSYLNKNYSPEKKSNQTKQFLPKTKFTNLSDSEIIKLNELITNVKSDYFYLIKEIEFTGNLEKCESVASTACDGYNQNNKILVEVKNWNNTKRVLCHEILHSYFRHPKTTRDYSDPTHRIINELAKEGVCYKN